MKIFFTGSSLPQTAPSDQFGQVTSFMMANQALVFSLKRMGHEVTTLNLCGRGGDTPVDDGSYDVAFFGLYCPSSWSCTAFVQMLNSYQRARTARVPTIIYVDDWHVHALALELRRPSMPRLVARKLARYYGKNDRDWVVANSELLASVDDLLKPYPGQHWLVQAFPWYQVKKFSDEFRILENMSHIYDPTPYLAWFPLLAVDPQAKKREWLLGTRYDMAKWMGKNAFGWPVFKSGRKRDGNTWWPKEQDVLYRGFYPRWGALAPPYPTPVSTGQWRSRYQFGVQAKTIIYGAPEEAGHFGLAYRIGIKDVESMTTHQLIQLAEDQAGQFMASVWSKDEFDERLDTLMATAMQEVRDAPR